MAQGAVAGVLRVGGLPGPIFTREDLRLLDILSSFASLSLENAFLFSQVQETALRDGLTGLWTHRALNDQLDAELLEASRFDQPLSIILMDVDHFKSINDTYGHQAGDQVLQGFAQVLLRNVRNIDFVARYGGEEFVVLLLQTPAAEAIATAEKIRRDLEAQRFDVGGKIISITGSFGVSTFSDDAASAQQLMRFADQRMYAAKKAGRNQVIGRAA
jgi:diguanylate cyclase (GGDEF)-like protein